MKKQVLETTCDSCDSTEWVDFANAKAEFTLPKNWLNVVGKRNGGEVFDFDFCPVCTMQILAAGGRMPASIKPDKSKDKFESEEDLRLAVDKLNGKFN